MRAYGIVLCVGVVTDCAFNMQVISTSGRVVHVPFALHRIEVHQRLESGRQVFYTDEEDVDVGVVFTDFYHSGDIFVFSGVAPEGELLEGSFSDISVAGTLLFALRKHRLDVFDLSHLEEAGRPSHVCFFQLESGEDNPKSHFSTVAAKKLLIPRDTYLVALSEWSSKGDVTHVFQYSASSLRKIEASVFHPNRHVRIMRFGVEYLCILWSTPTKISELRGPFEVKKVSLGDEGDIVNFLPCVNGFLCLVETDEEFRTMFYPHGEEPPVQILQHPLGTLSGAMGLLPRVRGLTFTDNEAYVDEDTLHQDTRVSEHRLAWWEAVARAIHRRVGDLEHSPAEEELKRKRRRVRDGGGEGEGVGGGGSGAAATAAEFVSDRENWWASF